MLIAFLGLVAVIDWLLAMVPYQKLPYLTEPLSIGSILGWIFYPIAAVMGVPEGEITALARLLGTKLTQTELVAYLQLTAQKATLSPRTVLIASFALCGFANFGSVAIQIGGLSAMAPDRQKDIAGLAFRAMFAGAIATCMTACIAGAVIAI